MNEADGKGGGQIQHAVVPRVKELATTMDWTQTEVGPMSSWPAELRAAWDICIGSLFGCVIYWGPKLTTLYNQVSHLNPPSTSPIAHTTRSTPLHGREKVPDRLLRATIWFSCADGLLFANNHSWHKKLALLTRPILPAPSKTQNAVLGIRVYPHHQTSMGTRATFWRGMG